MKIAKTIPNKYFFFIPHPFFFFFFPSNLNTTINTENITIHKEEENFLLSSIRPIRPRPN